MASKGVKIHVVFDKWSESTLIGLKKSIGEKFGPKCDIVFVASTERTQDRKIRIFVYAETKEEDQAFLSLI